MRRDPIDSPNLDCKWSPDIFNSSPDIISDTRDSHYMEIWYRIVEGERDWISARNSFWDWK